MSGTSDQIRVGEATWFQVGISQGKNGIIVDLKAHPKVEDFFRGLSNDQTKLVDSLNKSWFDVQEAGLKFYSFPNGLVQEGDGFSFQMPGYGFDLNAEIGPPYSGEGSNISCLRLVGISNPEGVRLGVKGIMSLNVQRTLAKNLTHNVRKFVRGYINTARVEFKLTGREVGMAYTKEW